MTLPGAEASGPSKLRSFHHKQTMGLYQGRVFIRKYFSCVVTICGSRRYSYFTEWWMGVVQVGLGQKLNLC